MKIINSIAIGGGKSRLSNIEALRLLSMLMVLNLHSFSGYAHGDGIGQIFDFFRESAAICAVDVFLLISGYFGIKWKLKSCYNLLFQVAFYSFSVYAVAVLMGFIPFETKSFLMCFGCYFKSWGFITCYIVLYFLSPILNKFVESSSKKELLAVILVLFLVENTICYTTGILNYILMYLVGRFLRKTEIVESSSKKPWMQYLVCTIIITAIVYVLYKFTPINTASLMTSMPIAYRYSSPFIILQAVFLFLCFARMNFTNHFINWCASSCLAIFLIHMHPSIKYIGYYPITESLYNLPMFQHAVQLIVLILCVFFASILIDKVRIVISEAVYLLLGKMAKLLPERFYKLDTYIPSSLRNLLG